MSSAPQAPPVREDGLQLSENRPLQRVFWSSQRVAWVVFGIVLLAALAGLTGSSGYFSGQTIELDGATVELPRIARWQANDTVTLELEGTSPTQVEFGGAFVERFSIESIAPEPTRSAASASGLSMTFDVSGEVSKKVVLNVRPTSPGWAFFDVAVAGERRSTWTVVLP